MLEEEEGKAKEVLEGWFCFNILAAAGAACYNMVLYYAT